MSTKLSVVINTLNEEANLPRALASIKSLADEIVVVDMKSEDATRTVARKAGAKVYEHKRTGYVEPARNFAISKAEGDWILILDADEEVPKELSDKIKSILKAPTADYFRIPRKNIVFRKWIRHSRWWPDYNIRLFKKGKVEWSEIIHSVPITIGKGADLEQHEGFALVHHHYDSIEQFITRLNRYTTTQAQNLKKEKYIFKWKDLIRKPTAEFMSRYFQGQGYKDGTHGLALALLQSFSELVLYLKLWQAANFAEKEMSEVDVVKELSAAQKELNFWKADMLLRVTKRSIYRIKRKFKLP